MPAALCHFDSGASIISLGQTIETRSQTKDENGTDFWLVTRTVYDSLGRVTVSTSQFLVPGTTAQGQGSAAARATRSLYDAAGRVYKTEQLKDVIVDIQNGVSVVTDEGTVVSSSETIFDSQGRTKRTIAADGTLVTVDRTQARKTDFRYDEHGNLVQTIRNDGSYTLTRYDSRGRVIAEMQPVDASVTAVWSDPDNSYIVSGSNPVQTIPTKLFEFDSQSRLSAVELPAVPDPDNGNALTRPRYEYGYNEQGNQTLIKDPLGRETRLTRHPLIYPRLSTISIRVAVCDFSVARFQRAGRVGGRHLGLHSFGYASLVGPRLCCEAASQLALCYS